MNMVDYIDENGPEYAPRIAAGLAVLENVPVGSKWTPHELRDLILAETDLAERTASNLVYAARTCRNPLFVAKGKKRRPTYIRVEG